MFVGTKVGQIALSFKGVWELFLAVRRHGEYVGTYCNDILAERLITNLCPATGGFVDIGAHIGSISAGVIRHSPNASIYAVEAMPDKAAWLINKFPRINVFNCAVGNREGTIPFYINKSQSGYSSMIKPSPDMEDEWDEIRVKIEKLDDIIKNNVVDIIKIDVEGAEYEVLCGSIKVIRKNRPIVMFESGPFENEIELKKRKDLFNLFNDNNYVVLIPNRVAHHGDGLTMECFVDSHVYPRRTTNYFAIPAEKRLLCREKARDILNFN